MLYFTTNRLKKITINNEYRTLECDNQNLIAWYKFDGDFTDSSGNGNTLTIGNGTPTTSSTEYKIGESSNFLSNDSYIKIID